MPKKNNNIKIDVCGECGKPKMTEAMNHFKAVQEVMHYLRINDNHPYMTEELPLYEGKIV